MRIRRALLPAIAAAFLAACSGPEEPSLTAPTTSEPETPSVAEETPDSLAFQDPVGAGRVEP